MPTGNIDLQELVGRLATRAVGRPEAEVQADVRTLLLAAPLNLAESGVKAIHLESPAGDRRRIDVEAGFTVIEVKRDLRVGTVRQDAVTQLAGYVAQRTALLDQRYVGILTDGAEWSLYHLIPTGSLEQVGATLEVDATSPNLQALLVWLEGVLATQQQIVPTPQEIEARLGAESPSHDLDFADLLAIYNSHRELPSVRLKRQLWAKLLTTALGTAFEDDDRLFVEHTLLVVTAEVIAHAVVGYPPALQSPTTLLSGGLFDQAQITGVVEQDFFDWLTDDGVDGGEAVVRAVARRLSRFAWDNVAHDVMKILYESVIGPEQRHALGEYYTPDWLAQRMVEVSVTDPLKDRVLDPACGSGTFLFWAVRRYLAAAEQAGESNAKALVGATEHVIGVDLHPLAVAFARVTYLLALGMDRIGQPDRPPLSIPVFLGDSLQWGQEQTLFNDGALTVSTGGGQLFGNELRFPDTLISDATSFGGLVTELADKAANRAQYAPPPSLRETFRRYPMGEEEQAIVVETFGHMCQLHDDGRDHIWGYYVRNLARPTWLAEPQNRVDVVIGNPPWLTYNAIATDLKQAFRAALENRNLWGGARAARNHDLSALFVVRSVELYLKAGGRFAFVMPYATLSRRQFTGFRRGDYSSPSENVTVHFDTPWDLDGVRPHPFPVPCAVMFGRRTKKDSTALPAETQEWVGQLPARNIDWPTAKRHLTTSAGSITVPTGDHVSPYGARFESGAKLNPQVLVVVEPAASGPLGVAAGFRRVRSIRSVHRPWDAVLPLEGIVEEQFVRSLHLGSTILPFRAVKPVEAIVPWDPSTKRLLEATDERLDRYPKMAEWWRRAAALWDERGTPDVYSLTGRIDFQRKLSRQLPPSQHRVVYTASGSRLAAARLSDANAIVQHVLYWGTMASVDEAQYLVAILNSETVSERVAPFQSRGQFGARHFDKYIWYLAIPQYAPSITEHEQLATLGAQAELVAANVPLAENIGFRAARTRVRSALENEGVAEKIEAIVRVLLPAP